MKNAKKEVTKKRLSDDQTNKLVMEHINNNKSISDIALENNVSEQTVRNWVNKYRNSKKTEPSPLIENITDYVYANIIPTPLVYTLEEAASVAKISPNQLLHYAVLGKITLFFDRPIDVLAMSEKDVDLAPQNYFPTRMLPIVLDEKEEALNKILYDTVFKRNFNCFKCNFLAISQDECNKLEMGVIIRSYKFDSIYFVNENNELIQNKPISDKGDMEKIQDFYYAFKEEFVKNNKYIDIQKNYHAIDISKGMLKVSSKELSQLVSNEINRKSERKPSQEQFAVHENKSTFLIKLDQAAFELWGDFNPIKAAIYNTSGKVGEYLENNFGFCAANAYPLAVIITPSANNPILPIKEEDAQEITYRPRLLSGVLQAWSAVCMPKKFEKGDSQIRYEDVARKWLTDNWPELTKYEKTISNVVKLITPDNSPFDKLRKSKK